MNRPHISLIFAVGLVFSGCGTHSDAPKPAKHYQLSGEVVALDAKDKTATVKHGAVGDWMGPMTMEYPVRAASDFESLHVGDKISATVNVRDDADYDLSDIRKAGPQK